jgi:hypothetical protein
VTPSRTCFLSTGDEKPEGKGNSDGDNANRSRAEPVTFRLDCSLDDPGFKTGVTAEFQINAPGQQIVIT